MLHKEHIKIYINRILLLLKSLKFIAKIPLFFMYLVVPLISLCGYIFKVPYEELVKNIEDLTLSFYPFFSCWWMIFAARNYWDGSGSEILFVNRNKTKAVDFICLFFLMILNIMVSSLVFFILIDGFEKTFLRIFFISVFYFGVSYFFIVVLKSMSSSLMFLCIFTMSSKTDAFKEKLICLLNLMSEKNAILDVEPFLFCIGLVLFGLGLVLVKNKKSYTND